MASKRFLVCSWNVFLTVMLLLVSAMASTDLPKTRYFRDGNGLEEEFPGKAIISRPLQGFG
ncbi:hypothetical protein SADUNF_Sadunf01G0100500 [Salix dunnii]|uniref:Glycine-rich protein n=1 Tax=Salix dunnii TaxID=1413687 RepID=A0A835TJV3_9ROSI|nr:hypothetical protein SADUNF_Sadunf01G0100500 [Salix dunnii]